MVERTVKSNYRIRGEWTIAYEVTHRVGVIIEWTPPRGPRLRVCTASEHGELGSVQVCGELIEALKCARDEMDDIIRYMDQGASWIYERSLCIEAESRREQ
jgi:hypothetical protein